MGLRALAVDAAITTSADILAADVAVPGGTGSKSFRVSSLIKAGAASASTLLAQLRRPAKGGVAALSLVAIMRNQEASQSQAIGVLYTYILDVPAGWTFNFRPGTNTTIGMLLVEEIGGSISPG